MADPTLQDMLKLARDADDPAFPEGAAAQPGGIDPLGLRQVNFDIMDRILPGLNNVARHVRPFVVVAWAARQAERVARHSGVGKVSPDMLRDFVDRIEVIYAWSQFLRDASADLPGRQVLVPIIRAETWRFGGPAWKRRRRDRRYSTAFTAPITYGPAFKALGWVKPDDVYREILYALPEVDAALDAFEATISAYLDHPAFSQLGDVEVDADDVAIWGERWPLDKISPEEQAVFADRLLGAHADPARRAGLTLMLAAVERLQSNDTVKVRAAMARPATASRKAAEMGAVASLWRRLQVRQLFRLALESALHWIIGRLEQGPKTSDQLVREFISGCEGWPGAAEPGAWLTAGSGRGSPTKLMRVIQTASASGDDDGLVSAIAEAVAFCLRETALDAEVNERTDRLPLSRALAEARAWSGASPAAFVRHVLESWVLAQHVYWSVGRGLNDARAGNGRILRLKVVLDEGGWDLVPGIGRGSPPVPTPDRLRSAMSLAEECGLIVL
jgi:hypothetical protein